MLGLMTRRTKHRRPEKSRRTRSTRVRPAVEAVEKRASPAQITILSPAVAVGSARLDNTSRSGNGYLHGGSQYGVELAKVSTNDLSLSESYAKLTYWNITARSKRIELTSRANASGSHRNASAQIYTSDRLNGGLGWIQIRVDPSYAGEVGRTVTVTLNAYYYASRTASNTTNFTQVSISRNGQTDLIRGTNLGTAQRTYNLNATVGSTFYVHMNTYSTAPQNGAAVGTARLDISVPWN